MAPAPLGVPPSSAPALRGGGPSATWAARAAKCSDDSVSAADAASGATLQTRATLDAPQSESCSTCARGPARAAGGQGREAAAGVRQRCCAEWQDAPPLG